MKSRKPVGIGRKGPEKSVRAGAHPRLGRGLFAQQRIRPGAYIATFEGDITDRDGMHVLWILDENGNEIGIEGRNALRYLNHSRHPNAEFIGTELHALRNIQSGAELTIHYGKDWDDVE